MVDENRGSLDIQATLRIRADAAARGGKHPTSVTRIVRCPFCFATYRSGPGCDACTEGLTTREETLVVRVPEGIAMGTKLRLAGKGHESCKEAPGDLFLTVEIDVPPPAEARSTKPTKPTWWNRRSSKEKNGILALVGFVLPLTFVVGFVAERKKLPDLGVSCTRGAECRSGLCLDLYEDAVTIDVPGGGSFRGFPQRTGGVCTAECSDDAECPSSMRCLPVSRTTTLPGVDLRGLGPGTPNARACSPR
jgi:hypothetical protein